MAVEEPCFSTFLLLWAFFLYHVRTCCRASTVQYRTHSTAERYQLAQAANRVRTDQSATMQARRQSASTAVPGIVVTQAQHSTAQHSTAQQKQAGRVGESQHMSSTIDTAR